MGESLMISVNRYLGDTVHVRQLAQCYDKRQEFLIVDRVSLLRGVHDLAEEADGLAVLSQNCSDRITRGIRV